MTMTSKSKKANVALGEAIELDLELTDNDLNDIEEGEDLDIISEADAEDNDGVELEIIEVNNDAEDLGVTMQGFTEVDDDIVDVDEDIDNLTWLIYGKNGTGKTTILSTTTGMLILAVDEGTLSIRDKAKGKAKKIKMNVWDKIESTYWKLRDGKWNTDKDGKVESITIKTKTGDFDVKSVGFDTITKLVELCLRQTVLGDKAKDPSIDVMKPTIAHWGQVSQKVKYWLSMYKELPIQKVWLCQERSNTENLDSDDYSVFPDVNNALRNYIQSEADVIARMYIKTEEGAAPQFRMLVRPDEKYVTKDRTNMLPGVMANPSLDKMYKKVFGK